MSAVHPIDHMTHTPDKIFVTYPGGSGGDLLTATCNGITVTADQLHHTAHGISYFQVPPFTLKKSDDFIRAGTVTLADVADAMPYQYVSTHLIQELTVCDVIRVVITDPEVMQQLIYRQQMLQVHVFRHHDPLTEVLKKLCAQHKYQQAAETFLYFASKHAHQINQLRSQWVFERATTMDFSDIMCPGFVPAQLSAQFVPLWCANHEFWLGHQRSVTRSEVLHRLTESVPHYLSRVSK